MIKKRVKLCKKCKRNAATKPHPCPYRQDVHEDNETRCTCCEDCQTLCADEI